MTTNIGEQEIRDIDAKPAMGFCKPDNTQDKKKAFTNSLKMFSPEFIGRINSTIHFDSLTEADCEKIITGRLDVLNAVLAEMSKKDDVTKMKLALTPEVYSYLISKGFSKSTGARDLIRVFDPEINSAFGEVIETTDALLNYKGFQVTVYAEMKDGDIVFTLSRQNVVGTVENVQAKIHLLTKPK